MRRVRMNFAVPMADSKPKSSPGEEKNKLFQLTKEPFWSDQVVDRPRGQPVTVYKEIKLVQFLQDSLWIRQVIADHNKRSNVVLYKSKTCPNKTPCNFLPFRKKAQDDHSQYKWNMAKTAECCNFLPLFSLNPIRKRRRFNPVANAK
ncbi:hypothetical protein OWV82_014784 [Melia azedarach]|uniref:Uncharacterized protein n=1 Tax=Melia azedarach TaxID=155640 RepID=A0ACC1XM66_MELAZ|nr:hypothetical protein OWV82_014784 [Melia azedarach]